MTPRISQPLRRFGCGQRSEHLRCATNLGKYPLIARRRVTYPVATSRVRSQNPKHRARRTSANIAFEECAKPFCLRVAVEPFRPHAKLSEDNGLLERKRSRRTVVHKLAQCCRRVDKAVGIRPRVIMDIAVVDIWQLMIEKPFSSLSRAPITPCAGSNNMVGIERL
jgi:hypothetical protein